MTPAERCARIAGKHAEELAANDLGVWWLSFCDPKKPKGKQFLGVAIVEAFGPTDAMQRTHAMGVNPGGEIMAYRVDPAEHPEALRNRLLQKKDLAGFGETS